MRWGANSVGSSSRQPGEIIVLFSLFQEYFGLGHEAFGLVWVVKCGIIHRWLFRSLTFFFSFILKRHHDIFFLRSSGFILLVIFLYNVI